MKKAAQLFIALGFFFLSGHAVQASYVPCFNRPGGDYQDDLNEWWLNNCPGHFPENIGIKSFIGHYKVVGVTCKLILQGNRKEVRMEIEPAYAWAKLPAGSLVVTFQRYNDFNNDYFSTIIVPGTGTGNTPESSDKNPVQITYSSVVKNGISAQNTHHESTRDRVELLNLVPSALGGTNWDLKFTVGWYESLDKCQFVKTN